MADASLYERLGGVFAIAAVVDHFSDAVIANPKVGAGSENPQLDDWSTRQQARLPGLKFMRTLWVCNVAGGPFPYVGTHPGSTPIGLEEAHRDLRITPAEFDVQGARPGEGRGPRSLRGPQGRGDRGIAGRHGELTRPGDVTGLQLVAGWSRPRPLAPVRHPDAWRRTP